MRAAIALANVVILTYTDVQWASSEHVDENAVISPYGMALKVGPPRMAENDRFLRLGAGGSFQDSAHDWCGLATQYEAKPGVALPSMWD